MSWRGETTLLENYLTEDKRDAIVTWTWWHDPGEEEEEPQFEIPSKSLIEATIKDLEPKDHVDMCESLATIFYNYGCAMPAMEDELSEDDTERIVQLQRLVVFREGLESDTDDMAPVNVSKREYIRTVNAIRCALDDVIPVLTCWGAEEEERGDWAGDRLALVTWNQLKEMMQKNDRWKEKIECWASDDV
ncbi:hypothetical protein BDN71DRAFT_1433475 [Pleurotus eryngii]|uniref:Uncharacterized protein n=1 Tax=Pleurotus eryngii TaxID=5323 RepID=A0A9P6D5N7_PLEER|nr:hypothetical protein BDN71DRAFT_1433475 [Pleurotus eryngii]